MTTTNRYIDMASSGGDGTTENHSGSTAAYASMSAWDSAEQTTVSTGNIHRVYCAGSTADTTGVSIGGSWSIADADGLQIIANPSAADSDGFYNSTQEWSTSHYRLSRSSSGTALELSTANVLIDGIQVETTATSGFNIAVDALASNLNLKNMRIRGATSGPATSTGISKGGGLATDAVNIENCIIANCITGVKVQAGAFQSTSVVFNLYNNIIRGCSTEGVTATVNGSGDITFNNVNNAYFDNTADLTQTLSGTIDYNAGEDADVNGTTNGQDIGASTWSTSFTDAANATHNSRDYEGVASGPIDGNGIGPSSDSTVSTTDLIGNSRSGTTCTIGPLELQAAGGTANPWNAYAQMGA